MSLNWSLLKRNLSDDVSWHLKQAALWARRAEQEWVLPQLVLPTEPDPKPPRLGRVQKRLHVAGGDQGGEELGALLDLRSAWRCYCYLSIFCTAISITLSGLPLPQNHYTFAYMT